jgi:hypothetical protein
MSLRFVASGAIKTGTHPSYKSLRQIDAAVCRVSGSRSTATLPKTHTGKSRLAHKTGSLNRLKEIPTLREARRQLQLDAGEDLVVRCAHAGAVEGGLDLSIDVQRVASVELNYLSRPEPDWHDGRVVGCVESHGRR